MQIPTKREGKEEEEKNEKKKASIRKEPFLIERW